MDTTRRRTATGTATVLIALGLLSTGRAHADEVSLSDLLTAQAAHFQRLHSLDITVAREDAYALEQGGQQRSRVKFRFQLEGGKFRTETGLHWPDPPIGTSAAIYTFDGHNYQIFEKNTLSLNVRDRPVHEDVKYCHDLPIFRLYDFWLQGVDQTFDAARRRDTWTRVSEGAQVVGPVTVDGWSCVRVDTPARHRREGRPVMHRVYFARDLDFYPILVENIDDSGQVVSRATVTQPLKVATHAGTVIIALEQELSWGLPGARSSNTYTIDRTTLSVNEDIPDDAFAVVAACAAEYGEGPTRSNSYSLDTLAVAAGPFATTIAGNTRREEIGLRTHPAALWFGAVAPGERSPSRTVEIMPDKTYLKRRLATAYSGDKDWLTQEMENAKSIAPEVLERIQVESTSVHLSVQTEHSPESVKARVSVRDTTPMGLFRESLLVRLNDDEGRVLRVPVVAEVRGEYKAAPAGLFFGRPVYGERIVRSCRVGPLRDGDDVEIVAPETYKGWLDAAVKRTDDAATVDVSY